MEKKSKQEKNKKKISKTMILVTVLVLLVIILVSYVVLNNICTNDVELLTTKSLVSMQTEYEKTFKTRGHTIEKPEVILDPYKASPLTALILFETTNNVEPVVTIKGKDELSSFTHTFEKGTQHYLTIYGLYPDTNNEVLIEYDDNGEKVSKTIFIKTDKLPENFILPTSVKADKKNLDNDLYFFTPSNKGYTCAYDVNGDVRWYLSNYALWNISRLENGHMLVSTERLIYTPYYMTGLYEIDMLGKIYNEYTLKGGYHHDYYEMPNGNLLVASDDFYNESNTIEDYIVEIDRQTGDIVKTFDLKDILPMTDGKSENWIDYDWFHNNSVWYDEETNSITLSGRHQDAVINISYKTGELTWIIGDPTNWREEYQKYFFTPVGKDFEWQWSQHAAMITPEGYVFILDNGNNKSKNPEEYVPAEESYTRGVMYKIDTEKMTIEQVWEYGKERGNEFYSPYISDVDYINENEYIVHSGGIVYIDGKNSNQPAGFGADKLVSDTVLLKNNKVIFEIILPTNNYRVEKMSLYNDTELRLGTANRYGTLGKTDVTKEKIGLLLNAKKIDDNYKAHKVEFTKEEDRLVIKGQFKKASDVKVYLYDNYKIKEYKLNISKKPYTALCVDIFTEEETQNGLNITRYINKDGLEGKYSVYIEIEGELYNTGNYIIF